jgi:pimeloyl-ACP methyl ester carboxylesterase
VPDARTVPSTDAVAVAVHDLGGTGPTLLCSHATGFHGWVWAPLAAALGDRYHSLAFDYRAHGDSTPPAGERFDWHAYAEDVEAVVDGLALERPYAIGHSMGAAALLITEIERPGTFAALAVYEPVVRPTDLEPSDGPSVLVQGARKRRSEFASVQEAYDNFASKPPLNAFTPAALRAYVDHGFAAAADGSGGVTLKCRPEHEAQTYEHGGLHRTFDRLDQIGCPVLLMAGNPEEERPSHWAERLAERIPEGRFVRMDGLGHFGPMEDPERVANVVADFFSGPPAATGG